MTQRTFILRTPEQVRVVRALLAATWARAVALDRPLTVTVARYHAKRTASQNRALHALLTEIAENVRPGGVEYDVEFWKELVRRRFIGTEEMTLPDGTRLERGLSTTTLGIGEFSDLIERVMHWCVTELEFQPTTL